MSEHELHTRTAWVSPEKAVGYIPGASARSIRDWCASDKVPGAIKLPSGRWQIPWTAVVAILGFDPRIADGHRPSVTEDGS